MKIAELFALLALTFGGLFGGWGDVIGGDDPVDNRASCSEVGPGRLHGGYGCGGFVELLPKLPDRRE